MATENDLDAIYTALALFASCIKSGESWSPTCERVMEEAKEALLRIMAALEKEEKGKE